MQVLLLNAYVQLSPQCLGLSHGDRLTETRLGWEYRDDGNMEATTS